MTEHKRAHLQGDDADGSEPGTAWRCMRRESTGKPRGWECALWRIGCVTVCGIDYYELWHGRDPEGIFKTFDLAATHAREIRALTDAQGSGVAA